MTNDNLCIVSVADAGSKSSPVVPGQSGYARADTRRNRSQLGTSLGSTAAIVISSCH
ncbi:MAG: hypothetical protein H6522_04930 [Mycolicibacterium sp.]|nr:hypothetical protein [Mycolicibacterium sp.]